MSGSHIAAQPVQIGPYLRQRCAWCGVTLLDYDLRRLAYPATTPKDEREPAMWTAGHIIRRDGPMSTIVEHEDGAQIPDDCCGYLDPEVTV